jgi:hypothetical protein
MSSNNTPDYLTEDTIVPEGQKFVCISFLSDPENKTTLGGIKIRGVFSTLEAASDHAKNLQNIDKYFNVFVGEVGKWLPYDPAPTSDKAGSPEYAQEQLNNLMKGYLENQNKAKIFEEKRKVENIRKSLESQIENSQNNVKEAQQKLLESTEESNTKSLKDRVSTIEKQIKELEEKAKEMRDQEGKLEKKLQKMSIVNQQQLQNVEV